MRARDFLQFVAEEAPVAFDNRGLEILHDAKTRRGRCRRSFANRAERIADLAHVGGAQLEAECSVHAHCVEELAAHKLGARNERLWRADVFLDQRNAVDRILERVAGDVLLERVDVMKLAPAEAFARAVVLVMNEPLNLRAASITCRRPMAAAVRGVRTP